MKIIMTCGGTGGHIYPAIAIANKIKLENPSAQIVFIGTGRPLEKKIIPAAGYELRIISASGVHRRKLYRNFATAKDMIKGMVQAGRIIREVNPVAVIGTGGYVCVPVITRAHQMGIKTYIHEQNAKPGLANRWLASRVDKIFLGFEEAASYFKDNKKVFITGNPIRKSFEEISKLEARRSLSDVNDNFMVLIFGGSLGAAMINKSTIEALPILLTHEKLYVYFVTGSNYYEDMMRDLRGKNLANNPRVKILEYAQNMDVLLGATDIVVSRAGALTLAEEGIMGTPAVLIPSPNVTGNHQFYNAKAVSETGGAILLEETELSGPKLADLILDLVANPKRLEKMRERIKTLGNKAAVDIIYNHLDLNKE